MAAARRRSRSSRRRRADVRWRTVVGVLLMLAAVGIGALVWSRTGPGQAALLHLGAEAMYGVVQARVDSVLAETLPDYTPGPAATHADADAHDWPLPGRADAAAVRCRVSTVGRQRAWWQVQADIDAALRDVGARVLWGERLPGPRGRRRSSPDERSDILRLDLGVPGHATHTLALHRRGTTRPPVRWGGDPAATAWRALRQGDGPLVAIVIDDWGYRQDAVTQGILDLPIPLTMSVLPGLPYSRKYALEGSALALPAAASDHGRAAVAEVAQRRRSAGSPVTLGVGAELAGLELRRREIMLHLPMEAMGHPDPGPTAVAVGMDRAAIAVLVDGGLASLPNVRGVNNHQGSAATADEPTMHALMDVLAARDLFFLDSLTSPRSVAYETARSTGVPAARNRIFLDDDHRDPDRIRQRLRTLIGSARASGAAIGIGHPHPATLEVLAAEAPRLAAEGVRFVTVSELIALLADGA